MVDAQRIKEEVPMLDLLPRLGFSVPPGRKNFSLVCPFHNDHSPSAWVKGEKDCFICFRCDCKLDVIAFVQQHQGIGFRQACEWLCQEFAITDDPLQDMWKRFNRSKKPEERLLVGDVANAFLNRFHCAWWTLRDAHPTYDQDLREMRQGWMTNFDGEHPEDWFRRATADLERWQEALEIIDAGQEVRQKSQTL